MTRGWRRRRRPRCTVIIPTYNWATVLPFSIESVLDQTWSDFELLVVGDGCTDESADVVGAIADPRVQWVNLPENSGSQYAPNNEGLRRARGGIVAYLGHDDLWARDHLAGLVAAIDGGASLAHARVLRVDPGITPFVMFDGDSTYRSGEWLPPTSVAHRRDVALAVGGWRPPTATGTRDTESDLWHRIVERSAPPVLVPAVTCIKLPAALRHGSYRDRPSTEQAAWLERLRSADDPDAALRAACLEDPGDPAVAEETARLLARLGPASAAERQRLAREVKGLPAMPDA